MEQIRKIVYLLTEEKFLAGEYLSREGESSENFYIIIKGECECCKRTLGTREEKEKEDKDNEGVIQRSSMLPNQTQDEMIWKKCIR